MAGADDELEPRPFREVWRPPFSRARLVPAQDNRNTHDRPAPRD